MSPKLQYITDQKGEKNNFGIHKSATMSQVLKYWHIDVFTNTQFQGNPAAVFFDTDTLQTNLMQRIASELNLSETVFLQEPKNKDADYYARIFTPYNEIPFAGHPTIAACYAYSKSRKLKKRRFIQECKAGLIPISTAADDGGTVFTMQQKNPEFFPTSLNAKDCSKMLGLSEAEISDDLIERVSTGLPWLIFAVNSVRAMERIIPNHPLIVQISEEYKVTGITIFTILNKQHTDIRVRTFAPKVKIFEDPTCGSGNGCVGSYIAKYDLLTKTQYISEQGVEIGRNGKVFVKFEKLANGQIHIFVGGKAIKVVEASLSL